MKVSCRRLLGAAVALAITAGIGFASPAGAQDAARPNILIIWGDDIGWYNISAYNLGVMGYRTPNIDRIAKEGALFTDWYGQQSCTAGRAAFITGQSPVRTGLTKVGLPGAELGLKVEDPTIAGLLKNQGYMTGQYGKNHLGADERRFLRSGRLRTRCYGDRLERAQRDGGASSHRPAHDRPESAMAAQGHDLQPFPIAWPRGLSQGPRQVRTRAVIDRGRRVVAPVSARPWRCALPRSGEFQGTLVGRARSPPPAARCRCLGRRSRR